MDDFRENTKNSKPYIICDEIRNMIYLLIKPEHWNDESHINKLFDVYFNSNIGKSDSFLWAIKNPDNMSVQQASEMLMVAMDHDYKLREIHKK